MPIDRSDLLKMVGGALSGLAIGLLIAWGIWPVQWSSATLNELQPHLKAHYIAAVADAYVASGGQETATAVATRRLAELDNPVQAVEEAILFFQNSNEPDRNIRLNNLFLLRPLAGGEIPAGEPANQDEVMADHAGTVSPPIGWFNWLLVLIAAIILLAGGLWVAYRILRAEGLGRDDDREDEIHAPVGQLPPYPGPLRVGSELDEMPAYQRRSSSMIPHREASPEPPDFIWDDWDEEEEDDEELEPYETMWEEEEETTEVPESDVTTEKPATQPVRPNPTVSEFQPLLPSTGKQEPGSSEKGRTEEPPTQVARQAVQIPSPPRTQTPASKGQRLGTFTVHYRLGIPDYDESFDLYQGEDQEPLGSCGMGANLEASLADTVDQITALDVWLYDRTDIRSFSYVLLSKYADPDEFRRRSPQSTHVEVAREGLQFALESNQLLLDCQLVELSYIESDNHAGAFSNVVVEMTAYYTGKTAT